MEPWPVTFTSAMALAQVWGKCFFYYQENGSNMGGWREEDNFIRQPSGSALQSWRELGLMR